jgi:hypothetical protein
MDQGMLARRFSYFSITSWNARRNFPFATMSREFETETEPEPKPNCC